MLHSLRPASGSRKSSKRLARGNSANGGTTAGRGTKGQQSRTGKGRRLGFEGGQVPLIRRQPKLGGFTQPGRVPFDVVNLATLEKLLEPGTYTVADLVAKRLARSNSPIKILAQGKLSKKFDIEAHAASKSAKAALAKAGGSFTSVR